MENGDTCILVDTSPDLRQQLLNADIGHLDAVLYTHYHADHLHGIDDLRQVNRSMNAAIDMYADFETIENDTVTVRDRDSMSQKRVSSKDLIFEYKKVFN